MNPEQQFGLVRRWEVALAASRDQRVPRAAFAVLMSILDRLSNENGDAWPSLSRIAADTGISRRSVVSAVASLVYLGYLERQSGNRTIANVYRLARETNFPREACCSREADFPRERDCPREADFPGGREISRIEVGKQASLQPTHRTYPIEPTQQRARSRAVEGAFDQFWGAYPRKVAKGAARKAFAKLKPDPDLLTHLLDAIATQQASEQWRKEGGKFIPHASTWLSQERWLDQLPDPRYPQPTAIIGESLADRSARLHALARKQADPPHLRADECAIDVEFQDVDGHGPHAAKAHDARAAHPTKE